jgi:ActR/RegA family two-component response regulator
MSSNLRLDSLLFSDDTSVQSVIGQVLTNFSIQMEVCHELRSALDIVTHQRLDAVIVDWEESDDPVRIVRAVRKSSPNSNSTIVGLVNAGSETRALLVGTNFMIHKPADVDHARRCMRAAYGTILQNRRRAARVPVDLPVEARLTEVGKIEARISDLSVGGLALQCKQVLEMNREVLACFALPGSNQIIHVTGKVVNADAKGRAGIRFSFVPEEDLDALELWLANELSKLEKTEMPTDSATYSN